MPGEPEDGMTAMWVGTERRPDRTGRAARRGVGARSRGRAPGTDRGTRRAGRRLPAGARWRRHSPRPTSSPSERIWPDCRWPGVPVAVKDNLAVRGEAARIGSAGDPGRPADRGPSGRRRLRERGGRDRGPDQRAGDVRLRHHRKRARHPAQPVGHRPRTGGRLPGGARRRSPPGWRRSPEATTGWARCASRPRSAGWSPSSPGPVWCRPASATATGSACRRTASWPPRSRTRG